MPIENTTPNRSYQLPFGANNLADDVLRLISALSAIDIDVAAILVSIANRALLVHQHVIGDTTGLQAALDSKQDTAEKGNANGYAGLDATGKVPTGQLPASIFGALSYQGDWNANTNTPTIPAASSANKGWYYMVSVDGAANVGGYTDWKVGDWAVSSGTKWTKIDNTDAVVSVAGLYGAITAAALKAALAITFADVTGTIPDAKLPARLGAGALNITDCNAALDTGWYRGNGVANAPSAGYFLFEVVAWSTNDVMQTASGWLGAGAANLDTWRRFRQSGTWSAWFKLQPGQAEQEARYAAVTHTHTFASLTSKPTTLAGYGITDGGSKLATAIPLSGAATDVFGIPAGTTEIVLMGTSISFNASGTPCIQLGTSGGIVNSGYSGSVGNPVGGGAAPYSSSISLGYGAAADIAHCRVELTLSDAATNTWHWTACVGLMSSNYVTIAGKVSLPAALDRVRVTTTAGTASADSGSFAIRYS